MQAVAVHHNRLLRTCRRIEPLRMCTNNFSSHADYKSSEHLRPWLHIWKKQQDNFTLPEVNENLKRFEGRLFSHKNESTNPPSIFVPLCGKSVDLAWLAEKGYVVIGLDGIAEPMRQWAFQNGGLEPIGEMEEMTSYRSRWYPNLNLLHGDIFALHPNNLGTVRFDAVWDRGGITSIAPEFQQAYAKHIASLMAPDGKLLLEFLSCNAEVGEVSSFIDEAKMHRLLASAGFRTETLKTEDVKAQYPDFNPPGLAHLHEVVVLAELK